MKSHTPSLRIPAGLGQRNRRAARSHRRITLFGTQVRPIIKCSWRLSMISRTAGALLVITGFAANGLAADAKQEFEVASIKPAPPLGGQGMFRMGSTGGPGSRDPGRYSCEGCPLTMLVM